MRLQWIAFSFLPFLSLFGSLTQEKDPWTVDITGSFIYWNLAQDNMELGTVNKTDPTSTTFVNGNVVNCDFTYSPGFILGIGWNLPTSDWTACIDYTWLRSHSEITTSLIQGGTSVLAPYHQVPDPVAPSYYFGHETWKVAFNFIDVITARSYYLSAPFSFRPFFGARNAWIAQQLHVQYLYESTNLSAQNVYIKQSSHSWGIGPRLGLDTKWDLGSGWSVYGNWGSDILFTQYTKISHYQYATTSAGSAVPNSVFHVRQTDLNHVRIHLDLSLGFDWQKTLSDNGKKIYVEAGYTFQVFLRQNMFRQYIDDRFLASISANGDLEAHGLTATVRFDF